VCLFSDECGEDGKPIKFFVYRLMCESLPILGKQAKVATIEPIDSPSPQPSKRVFLSVTQNSEPFHEAMAELQELAKSEQLNCV
jgi:hypothetical protein